ncbi:MAG: hypothetical protein L6R41_005482 [Letrouitia leprolyta]|nr:MAG: hypothetical protein L6R41_005482 [Letrouitia leprolyta]
MRFRTLSIRYVTCLLVLVSFAIIVHAAPSPPHELSTAQDPANSDPHVENLSITKRVLRQHTIANGWKIQYQLFNFITPVIPALFDLKGFYLKILQDVEQRMRKGEAPGAVAEFSIGQFTLSLIAEKGFKSVVDWGIIFELVDQLMDGTVPITFMCHVAPPGSVAGIAIKLWVRKL